MHLHLCNLSSGRRGTDANGSVCQSCERGACWFRRFRRRTAVGSPYGARWHDAVEIWLQHGCLEQSVQWIGWTGHWEIFERAQLPSFDSCCISFWTFLLNLDMDINLEILVWHWCVAIPQIWPFIHHFYWDPLATLPVGVFLEIWKLVHLSQTPCRARSAAPHKELTDLRRQLAGQWRAGISQWAASWKQQPWMENQTYHFHGQFQGSATDPPLQHLNVCAEVDHLNGREIVTELGSEKAMRR